MPPPAFEAPLRSGARRRTVTARKQPVLVSIAYEPLGGTGWHIMPVVDATDDSLMLLKVVDAQGSPHTCGLSKLEFIRIHDNYAGGDDVAYLEKWQ